MFLQLDTERFKLVVIGAPECRHQPMRARGGGVYVYFGIKVKIGGGGEKNSTPKTTRSPRGGCNSARRQQTHTCLALMQARHCVLDLNIRGTGPEIGSRLPVTLSTCVVVWQDWHQTEH